MKKKAKKEPAEDAQPTRESRERAALLIQKVMDFKRTLSERKDPMVELDKQWDISSTQHNVIVWLGYDGPLQTGELSRRAQIHDKSITGVVDRLEKRGLIQRERSPEDRRTVIVTLTDEGRKLYAEIYEIMEGGLGWIIQSMDEQEETMAFQIVERLLRAVNNLPH
ncbi:MarR family winged helix-turn-helix transcriptional regulator [Hyalangium versicolor]|uniref:MarR family winged helix-turn-helix transcriptional regulator n=1 Tax=Hyalangium versicolor TaxID=2861190 RepID=UPI001CCCEB80|nr:MarR family transcriptional regulator [Hyalangium versicolor]